MQRTRYKMIRKRDKYCVKELEKTFKAKTKLKPVMRKSLQVLGDAQVTRYRSQTS